jgi:hypothetical protein
MVRVALFGAGPGLYVDLARFSFQVPTLLSAAEATTVRAKYNWKRSFEVSVEQAMPDYPSFAGRTMCGLRSARHGLPLRHLIHGVDVVNALDFIQIALLSTPRLFLVDNR